MLDDLGLVIVFSDVELAGLVELDTCLAKLYEQMQSEPHLLHPSVHEMAESFTQGNACMILEKESFCPVAFARLIFLTSSGSDNWYEFGTVFVSKNYRGVGLGTVMYQIFISKHEKLGKKILGTTTNPAAIRVGQKCGFVMWKRRDLPEEIWRSSCVCSINKTGPSGPDRCRLAYGEEQAEGEGLCYFRLSPETNLKQVKS